MRSPLSMPGPWHAWAQYSQSIRSAICYLHTNLAHHISPLFWMSKFKWRMCYQVDQRQ